MKESNQITQITDTPCVPCVRTHTSTSHDSSNHPHPPACPVDPKALFSLCLSRPTPRRRSRASIDRSSSSSSSRRRRPTASRPRTNRRMKIHTSRLRRAFSPPDVAHERTRAKRSDDRTNPRSTIRALDATRPRGESSIDRADANRAFERDANGFECERTRCDRTSERFDRRVASRRVRRGVPRLANARANDARE